MSSKLMCSPHTISYAWVDPTGKIHSLPEGVSHNEWAEDFFLAKEDRFEAWAVEKLLGLGWARVSNSRVIEVDKLSKLVKPVKEALLSMIMQCATMGEMDPEKDEIAIGESPDRTRWMSPGDFAKMLGGRAYEDKLYFSLPMFARVARRASFESEAMSLVKKFSEEYHYPIGSCDLGRADCITASDLLADMMEDQGIPTAEFELWSGEGFIPALGSDAEPLWIMLVGDDVHKSGVIKSLQHTVVKWGSLVMDLTGRQFGSQFKDPVYSFSEFQNRWADVYPAYRASKRMNGLRRMLMRTAAPQQKTLKLYHGSQQAEQIVKGGFDLSRIRPRWKSDYAVSTFTSPKEVLKFFPEGIPIVEMTFKGKVVTDNEEAASLVTGMTNPTVARMKLKSFTPQMYTKALVDAGVDAAVLGKTVYVYNPKVLSNMKIWQP